MRRRRRRRLNCSLRKPKRTLKSLVIKSWMKLSFNTKKKMRKRRMILMTNKMKRIMKRTRSRL
jgi:hypothetical protein